MSKHELEDMEAMQLSRQNEDRKNRDAMRKKIAKAEKQYRKRENLRFWANLLGIVCAGVLFVALGVTGQVAGWIENGGMALCLCWAAVTVDRKARKV